MVFTGNGGFLQTSGQITLNQIYNIFVGYHDLNSYHGQAYYLNNDPNTYAFPSSTISIKNFYGTGPNSNYSSK